MAQQGDSNVGQKPEMPFETAKALLASAKKDVLEDRAFGDSEGGWCINGREIAGFYFGGGCRHVPVNETDEFRATVFEGDQASELRGVGTLVHYERNDEQD